MKTLLLITIFVSISYSQNHYLSLEYDFSPTSKVYYSYFAAALKYHFSFLNEKIHFGLYVKYYSNKVRDALLKLPENQWSTGINENGGAYGLSLRVFPIDSALLGTSKILPFLELNYGKYDGYLSDFNLIQMVGKTNEGYSVLCGLGISYIERMVSFYFVLLYEFRKADFHKTEYHWPNPPITTDFKVDLSSALLNFGIRFRL